MQNPELIEKLSELGKDLLIDIKDVRNGKLKIDKAKAISKLASASIKSIVAIVVSVENQVIQDKKLIMRSNELKFRHEELDYKKSMIK